nr:MAG TPA: hypothetical protein [Caudoviricetes sp.]
MDILNKSKNFYRCVGTVYELGLTREDCEVKLYEDGKPTGEKVKAECIKGKFGVRTDGGIVTFMIYFASKGLDGKESRQWKMATDMMELNPEVNGNGNAPSVVVVEGRLENNMFMSRDGKEVKEAPQFRVSKVSTTAYKEGMEYGITVNMSGCMTKNVLETKMVNGEAEETGRGVMTVYMANGKGEVFPVTVIVPDDLVDDVNDAVENGCTIDATLDVNTITFGGVAKKHGIGRAGKIDTSNVSTRTEFVLAGMDIVDEPDEKYIEDEDGKQTPVKTLWMDSSVVKKAIKMYQVKKDEFAKNGGNKNSDNKPTGSRLADRKAEAKAKRVGKKKDDFDSFDDDMPWDDKAMDDSDEF